MCLTGDYSVFGSSNLSRVGKHPFYIYKIALCFFARKDEKKPVNTGFFEGISFLYS